MDTHWQDVLRRRQKMERLARQILRVSQNADAAAIKKAFRRLAKQCHPDKTPGDPEAHRRFQEIINAYEFLTNGESRGWNPDTANAADEQQIGDYKANDWGYFCWWRDNFFGAESGPRRRRETRKPNRGRSRPKTSD